MKEQTKKKKPKREYSDEELKDLGIFLKENEYAHQEKNEKKSEDSFK